MWPLLALTVGSELERGAEQRAQRERDTKLAAATQLYSPWTHLQAQKISSAPSTIGSALSAGASGFGQFQNFQNAEDAKNFRDAQLANLNAQGDFYKSQTPGAGGLPQFSDNSGSLQQPEFGQNAYGNMRKRQYSLMG